MSGQVQSAYQRRADLIPNLVNTVKVADFEKSTLTEVTQGTRGPPVSISTPPT